MPNISIILPTYNGERYIQETIESILNQTYEDFETIVIDDGSTDKTAKIIKELAAKFPDKIKYFYQNNRGIAAARNKGIKEASGFYIAFIDHDDLWMPEKLEDQINYLKRNQDFVMVYTNSPTFGDMANNTETSKYQGFILNKLIWHNFIPALSVLVRKEVFNEVGIFDEDRELMGCDDFDMWLRIANRYKIGYIPEPLVRWRASSYGYTYSKIDAFFVAQIKVVEKNLLLLKNRVANFKTLKRNILSSYYFTQGWYYFHRGETKKARNKFFAGLTHNPLALKTLIYYSLTFFPFLRYRNLSKNT